MKVLTLIAVMLMVFCHSTFAISDSGYTYPVYRGEEFRYVHPVYKGEEVKTYFIK